jgi:hypothetical protein
LKGSLIIQKPLAFFALLVFFFSATPKKFLHDLVADHQDFYAALPGDNPGISNSGFNCHIHDLVVSTPFLVVNSFSETGTGAAYALYTEKGFVRYTLPTCITKDSRGPPALS